MSDRPFVKATKLILFLLVFCISEMIDAESIEKRFGKKNLVECLESLSLDSFNLSRPKNCSEAQGGKKLFKNSPQLKSRLFFISPLSDKRAPYSFIKQRLVLNGKSDFSVSLPKNRIETKSYISVGGKKIPVRLQSLLVDPTKKTGNFVYNYLLGSSLELDPDTFMFPVVENSNDLIEDIGLDWVVNQFKNGFELVDTTELNNGHRGGRILFRPVLYEDNADFGAYFKFTFY